MSMQAVLEVDFATICAEAVLDLPRRTFVHHLSTVAHQLSTYTMPYVLIEEPNESLAHFRRVSIPERPQRRTALDKLGLRSSHTMAYVIQSRCQQE
jgi:hypothetical protein